MKFITDFLKENIKGIKILLGGIIAVTVLLYIAQLVGQHKIILISSLILAPIIVFVIIDEFKTEKELKEFQKVAVGLVYLISFFSFMVFSHLETYLDKKLIKGTVSSYMVEIEDDKGRIGYSEEKQFKPLDPSDNYKVQLIKYSLFVLLVGSPLLVRYMVKRKIDTLKI
jgi:hypothetical protein